MQNHRTFVSPAEVFKNKQVRDFRLAIVEYVKATYSNPHLIWEKKLRNGNQLVSNLFDKAEADTQLLAIQKSEQREIHFAFFSPESHQHKAKYRIVFDLNRFDETSLKAAIEIIKQKMNIIITYLNVIHRPDQKTLWKINETINFQYESGSLSYTQGNGDVERATQICSKLYEGLSPFAKKQGLTLDFIQELASGIEKNDGKGRCYYILSHNEFVWKNLFCKASDYENKIAIIADIAVRNAFPVLVSDVCKKIGFFMDANSTNKLALTNKASTKALDAAEAKQIYGRSSI